MNGKHEERYERNGTTVTPEEMKTLKNGSVCVVGCGGLGGGVIEGLVRIGVGNITAVDGDVFEPSNLNRQVLSNESNLGRAKAREAAEQMSLINSEVTVTPVEAYLDEDNAVDIVSGHDVVVDALDNGKTRKLLERACEKAGIPLVHGAIAGWGGQVAVVTPGSGLLEMIYADDEAVGSEKTLGNPSFTPAVVSAIEVGETIKLLLGRECVLKDSLLTLDLFNHEYDIISL